MKVVSLADARDHLSTLVNDAAHGGQRVVLSSRGRPQAALIGMDDLRILEHAGRGDATVASEMLSWIEEVERAQRGRRPTRGSTLEALREVREETHAGRNGVPRRQRRPQAARRRRG